MFIMIYCKLLVYLLARASVPCLAAGFVDADGEIFARLVVIARPLLQILWDHFANGAKRKNSSASDE